MLKNRKLYALFILVALLTLAAAYAAYAWTPLPVEDDPLVRLPGTQPGQVTLEDINRCLNCHEGYDQPVEPGFNWKGSMMAQAARDYLFWACMTVAGQDSIWAVGRPNAMDICERCHFPKGWLEGRSDPPNASAMTGDDYDGIQCDFCHNMYDPFFETTFSGAREGNDWPGYWDETNASGTPSQSAAAATHLEDGSVAQGITLFNGGPFYGTDDLPFSPTYVENGAGQFFVSPNGQKRASFADATARHQMLYSRYHKSKYFCQACHDVSNPVLANLSFDGTPPGDGSTVLTTESQSAYSYFHVERTFSEFMLSDYGQQGGAPGIGPFAPGSFETSHPNNDIATCQDCHMRDVEGAGADKNDVPVRPGGSTEHPKSGQPLHDLTGGNAWVSWVLASAVPGSPNHDSVNDQLLNQGPAALTLDLTQGVGFDPTALLAGVERATQQLELAASIEDLNYDPSSGSLSFRIQNQTGHKLISGFPEGRRMFINVKAYAGGEMIHEVNPYDAGAGTLKGLSYTYDPAPLRAPCPLGQGYEDGECRSLEYAEAYVDEQVYEVHPSSSLTGENETFHFALATGRYKDNRIPPKGFRIADAPERLSQPVWHGAVDLDYFTADEYTGGYDAVDLTGYGISIPGADYVEVTLYYQTTSREYIEFLRDEINGTASTLPDTAYIIQTDPFFAQLEAWGDTIWQLWDHNKEVPGAAPFQMAQASIGVPPQPAVRLTAAEQTVPESQGTVTVTVELTALAGVPVTVPYTVGGTAGGGGVDHDLADGDFYIPPGSLTADVTFDIVDDVEVEGDETIIVTLGTPQNATLGTPDEQTITILDNDHVPVVRLTAAEQTVPESQGTVTVTVELTATAGVPVTVPYTVGGTADGGGVDHDLADGNFYIPAGSLTGDVTFQIVDDVEVEGDETIIVTLGTPQNAILGTPDEQTITILDDDHVPVVRLTAAEQTVPESQGTVTVTVELTATAGVPVTVPYTVGGTADGGGVDHDLADGNFYIPAGSLTGDVTIQIVDDVEVEGDETIIVTLGTPQNAILGTPDEQTITVLDDDHVPVVRLTAAEQTVPESQGTVTVTVELTATAGVPVTVPYTVGGTAGGGGVDHDLVDGNFYIPPGSLTADVTFEIVDDVEVEGDETIIVTLGTPQNAILGTPDEQTITIIDTDRYSAFLPVVLRQPAPLSATGASGTDTSPSRPILAARRQQADR